MRQKALEMSCLTRSSLHTKGRSSSWISGTRGVARAATRLSGSTSPTRLPRTLKYQKRIKEIKGVHYRLDQEQWDSIAHKKFKIYGIPAYVLVHKDGSYEFHEDFLFHDTLISTLKSML